MEKQPRILFVDDEQLLHSLFDRLLTRHGMHVTSCLTATQAMEELAKQEFDLVVTDFMMPDVDGLELLSFIRQEHPHTKVIMITAHANVQHAVRSMQNGAIDYIPKPFSTTELVERIQTCLKQDPPSAPPSVADVASPGQTQKKRAPRSRKQPLDYVGEHDSIKRLKGLLPRVSQNKAPVFIQGESGTGKEILAKLIHHASDRADGPYVTLNCANLPRELVESHLFGHRKGAFTGAIEDMTGAFERADGGTLLLDEITEVDMAVQAKLLRVLQEQEIQKVGDTTTKRVDVRVIATSNRILKEAIEDGIFREDLFHRLSVFPLSVPPLRDRRSDVPKLARFFVEKYCTLYGLPPKDLSSELVERFLQHPWPGNVRQLENMVQRGVLLSAERELIELYDVLNDFFSDADLEGSMSVYTPAGASITDGAHSATSAPSHSNGRLATIEDMERHMIMQALEEADNNQQRAAERLGISARTIRNKLKKYRDEGLIN